MKHRLKGLYAYHGSRGGGSTCAKRLFGKGAVWTSGVEGAYATDGVVNLHLFQAVLVAAEPPASVAEIVRKMEVKVSSFEVHEKLHLHSAG